jgi:hypothetical protein
MFRRDIRPSSIADRATADLRAKELRLQASPSPKRSLGSDE